MIPPYRVMAGQSVASLERELGIEMKAMLAAVFSPMYDML